jgi:hypothetical protein
MSFQSKRALLWGLKFAGNKETNSDFHVKSPLFLYDFNQIWISSTGFHKRFQCQFSVRVALIHADTRTDVTNVIASWCHYV